MTVERPDLPDELDFQILEQLEKDGRRSYADIGEQLGVAAATVRTRVQRLVAEDIVEIVGVPDPWKLGVGFFATVALSLEPGHADEVADLLAEKDEISYVGVAVTGCDVLCEVSLHDAQEFLTYREQVLGKVPGFRGAKVYLIAGVRKLRYRLPSPRVAG
jgi:Lrp/AsnC family transcriptional regulator, regulator for asnA, asnC and gidA